MKAIALNKNDEGFTAEHVTAAAVRQLAGMFTKDHTLSDCFATGGEFKIEPNTLVSGEPQMFLPHTLSATMDEHVRCAGKTPKVQ